MTNEKSFSDVAVDTLVDFYNQVEDASPAYPELPKNVDVSPSLTAEGAVALAASAVELPTNIYIYVDRDGFHRLGLRGVRARNRELEEDTAGQRSDENAAALGFNPDAVPEGQEAFYGATFADLVTNAEAAGLVFNEETGSFDTTGDASAAFGNPDASLADRTALKFLLLAGGSTDDARGIISRMRWMVDQVDQV